MSKHLIAPAALAAALAIGNGEARASTPTPTVTDVANICDVAKANVVQVSQVADQFPKAMQTAESPAGRQAVTSQLEAQRKAEQQAQIQAATERLSAARELLGKPIGELRLPTIQTVNSQLSGLIESLRKTEDLTPDEKEEAFGELIRVNRGKWMTEELAKQGVSCSTTVQNYVISTGEWPNPTDVKQYATAQRARAADLGTMSGLGLGLSTLTEPTEGDIVSALLTLQVRADELEKMLKSL